MDFIDRLLEKYDAIPPEEKDRIWRIIMIILCACAVAYVGIQLLLHPELTNR